MTTTSKKLVPNKRFPEFENSGEWEEKKLEDIVDILDNLRRPISKNNRIPGQYPYYGANGIMDYINDYIFDGTYLLIGEDGSVINQDSSPVMHIAIGKFWVNNHAHVVKEKCQLYNLYFIYYALHNVNIEGLVKGIPPKLNQENLKTIRVIISDIKEQQKIADFLSSVDELIEYEKVRLEKLKEYKKGLLQNLFPKENQKVPDLRFSEFKNSGEWEEKKLEDIGNFYRGHSYSKEDVSTEDKANTIVLRSNNIDEYRINYNDLQYVTKKCRKEIIVKNNDIIICMSNGSANLVGKNAYIRYDKIPHDKKIDDKDITVGAFCGIYRTENQIVKYFFQSDFYKKQLQTLFAGSNINNLKGTDILSMYIYTPTSNQEQQKIADFLSSVDELIIEQINEVKKLQEYKKGLLQQLFPN